MPSASRQGKKKYSQPTMPPPSEANKKLHYIFGYGSLICKKSRAITAPEQGDKVATPVVVSGLERAWNKRTQKGMTALGIRRNPEAECVGVILPVSDKELKMFDSREKGYHRVLIETDQVEAYTEKKTTPELFTEEKEEKVKIWAYNDMPAESDAPIAQSYVDICLRGCMGISKDFAMRFITTTKGWSPPVEKKSGEAPVVEAEPVWVDDRDDPIYQRSDTKWSLRMADKLDGMLQKCRRTCLTKRALVDTGRDWGTIFGQAFLALVIMTILASAIWLGRYEGDWSPLQLSLDGEWWSPPVALETAE
jgi:hypothetical protein